MLKKVCIALVTFTCLPLANLSFAQPKVVPIGETIKPEGGTTQGVPAKTKKKRQASRSVLQAGKSFIVESATVLSSGLNTEGDTVYFRAAENVAGVITAGALAQGKVVAVENDRKHGKLAIQLESITAVNGQSVNLGGDIAIEGKGEQASLAVGEKFTAEIDEKTVVRGKPKKKGEALFPTFEKQGFAEVRPPEVKANLKKGTFKPMIEVLIEAPKGLSVADLDDDSVVMYQVNDNLLPQEIKSIEGKTKKGDKNKNGVTDLALLFGGWDFIKYQPRGTNTVYFKGKLKDGTEYNATTKVAISY